MKHNANLITPGEAAERLQVSVRTLAKWRSIGYPNIPYSKIGRCVRYKQADIDAFLARNTFNQLEAY